MRVEMQQLAFVMEGNLERFPASQEKDGRVSPTLSDSALRQSAPAIQLERQHSVSFRVGEDQRVYFVVVNDQTGEVVREVPPEEVRRAGEQISRFLEMLAAQRNTVSIDT